MMCKIAALVIGTRKTGTTWLYSNLLADKRFSLSKKVKESGFFSGEFSGNYSDYIALFEGENDGVIMEVDTSICYSDDAAKLIGKYTSQAKLILILRDPVEYLVSRFTHSLRKGEIKDENINLAVRNNKWLRDELDYEKIISRFKRFHSNGNLLIVSYESLERNPSEFYKRVVRHILGSGCKDVEPTIMSKINVARNSRFPIFTIVLTKMAKLARKKGLHRLVNLVKRIGLHSFVEEKVNDPSKNNLRIAAEKVILKECEKSIKIWRSIYEQDI